MGRLTDFATYLASRVSILTDAQNTLLALQAKYETFYQEVNAIRERELGQITRLVGDADELPGWLAEALEQARLAAEKEFDAKLQRLKTERDEAAIEAEKTRARSTEDEREIRAKNQDLDQKEEALKERSSRLARRIEAYNWQIREMGSGFGFFKNLFAMRRLTTEREAIEEEQAAVTAKIESLRAEWARRESEYGKREKGRKDRWLDEKLRAAALTSKLEVLTAARFRIVAQSAVERALSSRKVRPDEPKPGDPPCPRCQSSNSGTSHFCRMCARQLKEDRPDLEGSLEEFAELDHHHRRFSEGMRACQQIIALVKGILCGFQAFQKSVQSMIDSERRHGLSALEVDVPPAALEYGRNLEEFARIVRADRTHHPKEFGDQTRGFAATVFTESRLEQFFEALGQELSRRAKAQWG